MPVMLVIPSPSTLAMIVPLGRATGHYRGAPQMAATTVEGPPSATSGEEDVELARRRPHAQSASAPLTPVARGAVSRMQARLGERATPWTQPQVVPQSNQPPGGRCLLWPGPVLQRRRHLIRVLFVLLAVLGGSGLVLYVACGSSSPRSRKPPLQGGCAVASPGSCRPSRSSLPASPAVAPCLLR